MDEFIRTKRPQRLPEVMTRYETKTLFLQMYELPGLMGKIYIWPVLARRYPNAGNEWIWQYDFYTHVLNSPGFLVKSPTDL